MEDNKRLAHTKWNGKYHLVLAPKHRRKIVYRQLREEIGETWRELCTWKGMQNFIYAPPHTYPGERAACPRIRPAT